MIFTGIRKKRSLALLWSFFAVGFSDLNGQNQDAPKVQILQADAILRDRFQPEVQRLVGEVVLGYREARLRCDSAWRYDDGRFRTMGHVVLRDGEQSLSADEIKLNPTAHLARAHSAREGTVELRASAGEIKCSEMVYNLENKKVHFPFGGQLKDGDRTAVFGSGGYDVAESLLRLGQSVEFSDREYMLVSDSVHWHDDEDRLAFKGQSHLWSRDGQFELYCLTGEYQEQTESGWFGGSNGPGARVRNEQLWLQADSLVLPSDSLDPSLAFGSVEIRDTLEQWVLRGEFAERYAASDSGSTVLVEGDAEQRARWMEYGDSDTLILIADTMHLSADWAHAWPRVEFKQGDAIAACDTLFWNRETGRINLSVRPNMWLEGWLLRADSMAWELQDNQPVQLEANGHAALMKPLSETCYQQIAGRTISGSFHDSELKSMEVNGNAQSIYFDEGAEDPCEEFNQSISSRMRIDFLDGEVQQVVLLENPEGTWKSDGTPAPLLDGLIWVEPPNMKYE